MCVGILILLPLGTRAGRRRGYLVVRVMIVPVMVWCKWYNRIWYDGMMYDGMVRSVYLYQDGYPFIYPCLCHLRLEEYLS